MFNSRTISAMLYCTLVCALFFSCTARKGLPQNGWKTLFNGKDLSDWTIKIKDHPLNENYAQTFRVADGMMQVRYDGYDDFKRQYGHIYFNQPYSAYLLEVEYRFVGDQAKGGEGWATRNSGAMLHCQPPNTLALDQDFPISLEMQFLGGDGKNNRTTANLCTPGTNVFVNDKLFLPHCINSTSKTYHGEQWVKAQALVLADSLVQHIVNGDTVFTFTRPQYDGRDPWVKKAGYADGAPIKGGYISLQSESHPVDFRNVRIFDLAPYMNNKARLTEVLQQLRMRTN
ncbi:3-keto-disaccharide hydrolase [Pseudocnuella soli]|uniref:3-keto-disaccharide hydrolase n=1 Tax=Pseudocnuella soli TaxID=2502779 RepID=UPI001F00B3D5|nr:DUF1080 domain-containing protein [Pseudocnuella soli]